MDSRGPWTGHLTRPQQRMQLILTGIDDERSDDPAHHRLVCTLKGGGLVAFWEQEDNRSTIETVRHWIKQFGFPLRISADWVAPEPWAIARGHTYWLPETGTVRREP